MIRDIAAKRYAEAAYMLAWEHHNEEAWSQGLAAVSALFGNPEVQALMANTRVSPERKTRVVENSLEGLNPLVLNLARLLLRRGRTSLGPQIATAFQELLDQARGVSHAVVTTAIPLGDEDAKAVERKIAGMTGGQVVVQTRVDEGIIGGVVVRIGDRLIDGSTKSRLLALKRQLAGTRA